MAYRDDRDALHARNDALEAEVMALREQQARHEAELAEARGEPYEPMQPTPSGRVHPPAMAGLIGASVLAFALVMGVRAVQRPTVRVASHPVQRGSALALWDATLTSSNDAGLAPGAACTIQSRLGFERGLGRARQASVAHTTVRCNDITLYDATDTLAPNGRFSVSQRAVTEAELPLPNYENLEQVFDLDVLGRSDVARLDLDTADGRAEIDDASAKHYVLDVKPGSTPSSLIWERGAR